LGPLGPAIHSNLLQLFSTRIVGKRHATVGGDTPDPYPRPGSLGSGPRDNSTCGDCGLPGATGDDRGRSTAAAGDIGYGGLCRQAMATTSLTLTHCMTPLTITSSRRGRSPRSRCPAVQDTADVEWLRRRGGVPLGCGRRRRRSASHAVPSCSRPVRWTRGVGHTAHQQGWAMRRRSH